MGVFFARTGPRHLGNFVIAIVVARETGQTTEDDDDDQSHGRGRPTTEDDDDGDDDGKHKVEDRRRKTQDGKQMADYEDENVGRRAGGEGGGRDRMEGSGDKEVGGKGRQV